LSYFCQIISFTKVQFYTDGELKDLSVVFQEKTDELSQVTSSLGTIVLASPTAAPKIALGTLALRRRGDSRQAGFQPAVVTASSSTGWQRVG
jgi:hypothetical protein